MNYFSLQIFKFVLLYGLHFQVCDFSLFFSLLSLFSLFIDPRALFFFFSSPHFSFSFLLLFFFVSFIIFLFALITLSYFFQSPLEEIFHFLSFSFLHFPCFSHFLLPPPHTRRCPPRICHEAGAAAWAVAVAPIRLACCFGHVVCC